MLAPRRTKVPSRKPYMTPTVLLMTYEFPPAGGGGVQRVSKFARYLPDAGWTPVVVCAAPARGRPTDTSLLAEVEGVRVLRTPPRNPSTAIAAALAPLRFLRAENSASAASPPPAPAATPGAPGRRVPPLSARLARRFTADDAEPWARAAVPKAVALGREVGASAVIASGPPFSVLDAGLRVAGALGVPYVVDMRDPWRDNPVAWYANDARRQGALQRERTVMSGSAAVVSASDTMAAEARELGATNVRTLPNGFDSADLTAWAPNSDGSLKLAFMGKVYGGLTEPRPLLEGMRLLADRRPDLDVRFDLIGDPGTSALQVTDLGLAEKVRLRGYLPHREAIRAVAESDVGVILIADIPGAKATQTGKIFEYLGMGIPVLVVGPVDGEAAQMVLRARGGWAVSPSDAEGIAGVLEELAGLKRDGVMAIDADREFVDRFERRALTAELAAVLSEVAGT